MRATQRDDIPDTVLGRAVLIMDALRIGNAMSHSELARRTGLPKSTVHRLVRELRRHDLVETTDRDVRLGLHLFELGQSVPRQRDLREVALPVMRDLREATRNTAHLAVLDGAEVVYIEILHGAATPKLPSKVGGRMPAHCTAVGKAILAFSEAGVTDGLIARGLSRRTARSITMPGLLLVELQRIRESLLSYDREESVVGVVCAASPVFGCSGEVIAALSLTGWSSRLDLDRVGPAVRTAALALSRQLCHGQRSRAA